MIDYTFKKGVRKQKKDRNAEASKSLRIVFSKIRKCVFCYSHFTKCTFLKNNC